MKVRMWTDKKSMKKLLEYDSVSAYTKNDPDRYVGIREASNEFEVSEVGHVKGHQDRTGKSLSAVEKLNVLADKLATKVVG